MRITTKGRYALSAVVALAHLDGEADPVPIRTLAEHEGLSPDFLEQVFFKLRRCGIVLSVRGPGGGFMLARPSREISLHEILCAAGEDLNFADLTDMADRGSGARGKKPAPSLRASPAAEAGVARGIGRRQAGAALRELEDELRKLATGKTLADIVGAGGA
jgi:Rrf2 family iron-sulfur cluster assembly transcriptional regulator